MKHRAYPAYKPSGVEWVGEIPEHWELCRLKYTADLINVKVDGANNDLPYTGLDPIESWTGRRVATNGDVRSEGLANLYRCGDVLFGKLRPYLAKAHAADSDGICTGELLVLRPRAVAQKFLLDYVLNPDFIAVVDSSTYGAKMPRANWDFIGNLPALIPPSDEQQAITTFLDRETARIDALIEKKERQIELLKEKRSALISHAVTKGLDPNAKMKDSGIEWLGEIPAHWEVTRLGRIAISLQTGPFGSQLHASDYIEDGIPVINPANIQYGEIIPDAKCAVSEEKYMQLIRHRLAEGDIVFARRGEMGRCALVTQKSDDFLCGTGSLRVRLHTNKADPRYMSLLLGIKGIKDHLLLESVGSTMDNLNTNILAHIPIVVSHKIEQIEIRDKVDRETGRIHELLKKVEESINLLREYRISLISAAVTGKIDIRTVPAGRQEGVS